MFLSNMEVQSNPITSSKVVKAPAKAMQTVLKALRSERFVYLTGSFLCRKYALFSQGGLLLGRSSIL